jgi:hypothetical protein
VSDGFTFRLDPEQFEQFVVAVADRLREEPPETNGRSPEPSPYMSVQEAAARRVGAVLRVPRRVRPADRRAWELRRVRSFGT